MAEEDEERRGEDNTGVVELQREKGCVRMQSENWESEDHFENHQERDQRSDDDGEEKKTPAIELTGNNTRDDQPAPGFWEYIIQNHDLHENAPWPTKIRHVGKTLNLNGSASNKEGVREEKCGWEGQCSLETILRTIEVQVCEPETCSVGAKRCENRFWQRRL